MRPRNYIYTLFVPMPMLAAALAFAPGMPAQAKEGTANSTYAGFGTFKGTQIGKDRLLTAFDHNTLAVSSNPMFDHLTYHCWGSGDYTNNVGVAQGHCVVTDPAGDQFATTFVSEKYSLEQKSNNGSFTFIMGTGKFAGITGTGSFSYDGNMFKSPTQGTFFTHGTLQYNYQLP
jgi:hypothetical protein